MKALSRHVTRCGIAGIVALLPIAGVVFSVVVLERALSDLGLRALAFYFPGLAIVVAAVLVYLIGLGVTTFVGRWAWRSLDRLLGLAPGAGRLILIEREKLQRVDVPVAEAIRTLVSVGKNPIAVDRLRAP